MKKIALLTILFVCLQLSVYAQLRFGITGGLQSSKLHASASGASINTSGLFGLHLGGVAEYGINDNLFIRPELLYSIKGGSFNDGYDSYKTSLSYVELPIQGIYKFEVGSGKVFGGLGPYFGFLLGGDADGDKIQVGTDVKGFDAGLRLLGGYELTEQNLSFQLFYNAGLANINPGSTRTKLTNSTIGLSVSYFFGAR